MADPKDSTEAHHEHDPASVTPEEGAPKAEDSAPLDPIEQLRAELAAAQTQLAEQRDQALRAHAEMENVRRRAQEEVSKARKFGIE